ncbi:MAG: T9SS type A sorting domain-containing protein, partial [Saprospiraceae bacterium]|nr:T9SS type A sorting domain-containing protein [Saprospiraceae bacterium]
GSLTDFGDAPDQSVGNSYPTVLANDGPNHLIRLGGPYLGNAPDSEPDGQPDFNADGDTPDEDGLVSSITQEELQPALDTIRVSNLTLLPAKVTAWLDLNANGDFEESERRTAIVASGSTDVEVAFDFGIFPDLENVQFTYLRIRVSTELDAIDDPIGLAHDGEIEDHQISVQAALLPVGLTEFRAQYTVQQVVTLDWTTATETDNDHFEIERSSDGLYFGMIGSITGAGTSQSVNRYQYIDTKPHRGMNYYRLRQVDFSGSFSYSHVEIVQFRAQGQIAVYPNPASDYVRVEFPAGHPEVLPYTILNMLGVVVWTGSLSRSDAIDVSHLAEGLYQLRVKGMDTKHANTFLLHR